MHEGQDRVLGDGSWTRGQCPKNTKVARNKQAGVHGFELPLERPARQVIAVQQLQLPPKSPRARFSSARSGSAPRRRCETADLSPGFSTRIPAWPVLHTRSQSRSEFRRRIDKRVAPLGSAGTVRRSGVSSPAFPPRSPTPASSPQFLSRSNHRRAGRFSVSPDRPNTVPPSFARFEATRARLENPGRFSHTALLSFPFLFSLLSATPTKSSAPSRHFLSRPHLLRSYRRGKRIISRFTTV